MHTIRPDQLLGITLEGFQVFAKPTYIPFERLTLLFGPNSAGKSAVLDALELFCRLQAKHGIFERHSPDLNALIQKSWRRNKEALEAHADRMSLAVRYTGGVRADGTNDLIREALQSEWAEGFEPSELEDNPEIVEERWEFNRTSERTDTFSPVGFNMEAFSYSINYELQVKSSLMFRLESKLIHVNLKHAYFARFEKTRDIRERVLGLFPNAIAANGILSVGVAHSHDRGKRTKRLPGFLLSEKSISEDAMNSRHAALDEMFQVLDTIYDFLRSDYEARKVPASRTIPSSRDLRFALGDTRHVPEEWRRTGDGQYRELATSIAQSLLVQTVDFNPRHNFNSELGADVNRALSDHLFAEVGYQLGFRYQLYLSQDNADRALKKRKLQPEGLCALVELYLYDGRGLKHRFDEVGSGLGYVLPVLSAIYDKGDLDIYSTFVQQPELHLHPALQSALGDVFIEANGVSGRQSLIETHSEHLLLRMLKRVRQTHLNTPIAAELQLDADSLCVLYFNPMPDGTTVVKRLRVSEGGEFMDRWPRGFFGERDQELFDE